MLYPIPCLILVLLMWFIRSEMSFLYAWVVNVVL